MLFTHLKLQFSIFTVFTELYILTILGYFYHPKRNSIPIISHSRSFHQNSPPPALGNQ